MVLAALFIIGFDDGVQSVVFSTNIHKKYDNDNLGKVFASADAIITSVQFLAMALGGVLFDFIDRSQIFLVVSFMTILLVMICYFFFKRNIKKNLETSKAD